MTYKQETVRSFGDSRTKLRGRASCLACNQPWPTNKKTAEAVEGAEAHGGCKTFLRLVTRTWTFNQQTAKTNK